MLKHGATKPDGHKRFVWPCCLSDTIFPLDPIVASLDVRSASADPHVSCWPPALVLLTSDNEGSAVAVRSRSLSRSFAAGLDDPAVAEPARRGQDRSTGDHPSGGTARASRNSGAGSRERGRGGQGSILPCVVSSARSRGVPDKTLWVQIGMSRRICVDNCFRTIVRHLYDSDGFVRS